MKNFKEILEKTFVPPEKFILLKDIAISESGKNKGMWSSKIAKNEDWIVYKSTICRLRSPESSGDLFIYSHYNGNLQITEKNLKLLKKEKAIK